MLNLVWDQYDGITYRSQCAEILATSFLLNYPLTQELKISKQEATEFYQDLLDKKFFRWVFIFYSEDLNNSGIKQLIGVACANDMHDFLLQNNQIEESSNRDKFLFKENAFYAQWAKAKNVKKNEFFYMGDIGLSLEMFSRETISKYFLSCGYIYGIVKGLKPIKNEFFNKNEVILIPESRGESTENKSKKQILYAGKTEFLLNTFQRLLIQGQPKL